MLAVGSTSSIAGTETTRLLTTEEFMEASKKASSLVYRESGK